MKKRIISMILSATLIVGNMNGLEIKAANTEQMAEVNTVTLDAPEEEELEWVRVGDVAYMPEGITRIEESEFYGFGGDNTIEEFQGVKKLVLPSTLEYIGDFAFEMCELEEIVIPGNVKEIGNSVFAHCKNLKKVIFEGDSIEKIGSSLFWYCENIETVVLPNSVGEWDTDFAFMSCYKLKNVTVPQEGMDRLGTGMFYACALEEFTIPDCVTTMNYDVFTCCNELKLLKAGYNVVNFIDGGYDGILNISKGCFGTGYYDTEHVWHSGPANMVLEAPLDSAIVEYARDYRYFTVKYDYPDFERAEFTSTGIMEYDYDSYTEEQYEVIINKTFYPENTRCKNGSYHVLENNILRKDGDSPIDDYGLTIEIDGRMEYYAPSIGIFSYETHSQDENLEYTVKHTYYFKVTLTKQSLKEKRVQIEILTDGTWNGEDAQWELITPAIDTSILTPTPVPTKEVTPTATPETEKVTAEVPKVTGSVVQPTSKPVVTVKATPTPAKKAVKPAKVNLKAAKQLTTKKRGKKVYTKAVKVSWKKTKNADGYVIYMKSGKGKYKAVKTITNGKKVNYTKKNLKKGKTYYFKVRAYHKANGQKVYGNYSGVKRVKIK